MAISRKIVHWTNTVNVYINDPSLGTFDSDDFYEFSGNLNDKRIYTNGVWISIKDFLDGFGLPIEVLKPISKEEFYRTNYTKEEAVKIKEEYYNHYLQNAPSEP